jgi:GntR family transcriptional regulator
MNMKAGMDIIHVETEYGSPVLVHERFVSDPGYRPLEINIGFYIVDRFTYTIIINR